MPRLPRSAPGGYVYHVTNRGNAGAKLFEKKDDYLIFETVLTQALERVPTRILGWCMMPDHWHLVLWPKRDSELSEFMRWVGLTHSQRWHSAHKTAGQGHVYQGRFRSFPIQKDEHLLAVLRYVERNALRAKKVKAAEDWRWGSLWVRKDGPKELKQLLTPCPVELPRDWAKRVNAAQEPEELEAVRLAVRRSSPFGSPKWIDQTANKLDLQATIRPRGRPRIHPVK